MKFAHRMACLSIAASALTTTFVSTEALASDVYPGKPIRLVIPYPPGGPSDVTARLLGQKLSEAWGQPVVIDNRPGANGTIAVTHAAGAPADGYTLLMGNVGPNVINLSLYKNITYSLSSFSAVTQTGTVPLVLIANPNFPQKTLQELVAYAKANPGKLSYASAGNGASTHLAAELFKRTAGIDIAHVPYRGDAPAINDVIGGQIPLMMATAVSALPHIKAGRVKALAVTTGTRATAMPDVPTIAESGYANFDSSSWGGVLAPVGTPPAIISRLHEGIVKILNQPDTRQQLSAMGIEAVSSPSPTAFTLYMQSELTKWSEVVKSAQISMD